MSRIVRIGLVKAVPGRWDLEANWATFVELAGRAVARGAGIICTPECFLDGYVAADNDGWTEQRFRAIAQPLEGPGYVAMVREFARAHAVYLVFGFTERAEGGCYNAAALIDPEGRVVGRYHKTHLLDHDRRYLPGEALPVWETALGRIGILICADRRWPEAARTLKLRGAELLLVPSYGMWHLDNEWWMRTRSYENELYLCFTHPDVTLVAGPEGELAAKLQSNVPDLLVHDIDLDAIPVRMLPHRRPDLYAV